MPRSDLRPGHARGFGILGCWPQIPKSTLHATVWPQTRTCKGSGNFGAVYPRFPKVLCMPRSNLRPGHAKGLGNFDGLVASVLVNMCQQNIPWRIDNSYRQLRQLVYSDRGESCSTKSLVLGSVSVYVSWISEDSPIHIVAFLWPIAPVTKAIATVFNGCFPDVKRNACCPSISAFRSGLLKSSLQVLKKLPGRHTYIYIYIFKVYVFIFTYIYISFLSLFFVFTNISRYNYRIIHKCISLQCVYTHT